jgi:hypothetical protein
MYKSILIGYINDSKNDPSRKYLSLKNVSDEDVLIKAGESIFLNMTPREIKEKNPKVPLFSKSVKIEDLNEGPYEEEIN